MGLLTIDRAATVMDIEAYCECYSVAVTSNPSLVNIIFLTYGVWYRSI